MAFSILHAKSGPWALIGYGGKDRFCTIKGGGGRFPIAQCHWLHSY
jgi:hypothetical protein